MIYSQCKCGHHRHWGSGMDPARCCPCEKCGTVPASAPDLHPDPVPHDWSEPQVEGPAANPITFRICRICMRREYFVDGTWHAVRPKDVP